ncbi:MAG: YkgJ family cysteine cluster protein [Methanoregulaceae archaeon]
MSLTPIPFRIVALTQERNTLLAYPMEDLAAIIREVGFRCNSCGKCCTRTFNGHVFLLDRDAARVKEMEPAALEPAPRPEFCDQNGIFYVSGYALRVKDDAPGSCWFLEDGRCRVYDKRFSICRIYPYMLHREPGVDGKVDWRQISGLNEHGEYGETISEEESFAIARETKEYENAFLTQEIAFLEFMQTYFAERKLRHVQKTYDEWMRRYQKGEKISVRVYRDGQLEEFRKGKTG